MLTGSGRPDNLVKAVDSKFRKSAQEVYLKYSKVRLWKIGRDEGGKKGGMKTVKKEWKEEYLLCSCDTTR